ncbi:hypothetical protein GVN18_38085 [Pseudomonas sp. ODNR1LW]|nr:hypothetical protein [Pseudomonas sp. ODNR1LW]
MSCEAKADLDALEKLADEATPGEWTTYVSGAPEYNNVTHGIEIGPEGALVADFERKQDCDYVHAVQPATIKAVIDELRAARGLLERTRPFTSSLAVGAAELHSDIRAFLARLTTQSGCTDYLQPVAAAVLSATDRACYEYPGADQAGLRAAFVAGAMAAASVAETAGEAVEADLIERLVEMHKLALAVWEADRDPNMGRTLALMKLGDKAERLSDTLAQAMLYVSYTAHPSPPPSAQDDRLRIAVEALGPFAKGGRHRTMPGLPPSYTVADFGDGIVVTVADFRRAAEALAALKSEAVK